MYEFGDSSVKLLIGRERSSVGVKAGAAAKHKKI